MKKIAYLLIGFFTISVTSYSNETPIVENKQILQYDLNISQNHVLLPTNFAGAIIVDDEDLRTLKTNSIYRIDLVYTAFKERADFDQEGLNENRVKDLLAKVPGINQNNPEWNFVEQTKAKDRRTAKDYFHGFVIYYRDKAVDHAEWQDKFEKYQNQKKQYTVSNETATTLTYSSGTKIHVPANAVTYADGTPVKGDYEISYTEYRNPAQIALSGIPMTYSFGDMNYNFSSVGMYEIRGNQNGQELSLKKPIQVDFNCTATVDDAGFYQLNETTQEWELIRDIAKNEYGNAAVNSNNNPTQQNNAEVIIPDVAVNEASKSDASFITSIRAESGVKITSTAEDNMVASKMNKKAWANYLKIENDSMIQAMVIAVDPQKRTAYVTPDSTNSFTRSVAAGIYIPFQQQTSIRFVGKGSKVAASTFNNYANLVGGLSSPSFGVYNCDQTYRLAKAKTIHPNYINQATGEKIEEDAMACVIDYNFNGSLYFGSKNITLNPESKNALLVFTNDDQTYLILPEEMNKVNYENNSPTITMKNVTEEIKSSEDLKQILKI